MANPVTGTIAEGSLVSAADIQTIKRTGNQAANVEGGHGLNASRSGCGVSLSVPKFAPDLKTYQTLLAYNDGPTGIQPMEHVVIVTNAYGGPDHHLHVGHNQCLIVAHGQSELTDDFHWGIALDAIPAGMCGRLCIGGVTMALVVGTEDDVEFNWATNQYASSDRYLRIAESGEGQILWQDGSFGISTPHRALIRFPSGGGGVHWIIVEFEVLLPAMEEPALGYALDSGETFVNTKASGSWTWEVFPSNQHIDVTGGKCYYFVNGTGTGATQLLSHSE